MKSGVADTVGKSAPRTTVRTSFGTSTSTRWKALSRRSESSWSASDAANPEAASARAKAGAANAARRTLTAGAVPGILAGHLEAREAREAVQLLAPSGIGRMEPGSGHATGV